MFSNKYLLYPKSKTFEHFFSTDDLQLWYGKGTFKIKKKNIHLSFNDSEKGIKKNNRIDKIYNQSKKTDTLTVRFYDDKNNPPSGHIRYNEKYFYTDFDIGIIKISKDEFNGNESPVVETFIQGELVTIKLSELKKLETLTITAYDIYSYYHFESNFNRVLKFSKNQLKSADFYHTTNKRKVIFELE
ncbi:hypothetical protein GCM10022393_17090 [Aquimarina addita]|uniref:Uncharacterized protein n=2 Tax=Aquimarina addita TaxID=870485 RepID=A0ABP7XHI6_9FLAO